MPTSSATSLIVIRRLSKIIFFIALMISSVVDALGRTSLNRLDHNWTSVLLIMDSSNATVNISNVHFNLIFYTKLNTVSLVIPESNLCSAYSRLAKRPTVNISNVFAHLIAFFIQNLIQYLWSIFSNSKNRRAYQNTINLFICQKQTDNSKCLIDEYNRYVYQHNRK